MQIRGSYRTYLGIVIEHVGSGRGAYVAWMDYVTEQEFQPRFARVLDAKRAINRVRNLQDAYKACQNLLRK